jgi:hypothetical protein
VSFPLWDHVGFYSEGMPGEVTWTREQQENTLAALSVIREAQAGGEAFAAVDAMREVVEIAKRFGEP